MSQIFKAVTGSPLVATSYTTDDGTAVPQANILNVTAIDSNTNNDNGIQTAGGAASVG